MKSKNGSYKLPLNSFNANKRFRVSLKIYAIFATILCECMDARVIEKIDIEMKKKKNDRSNKTSADVFNTK